MKTLFSIFCITVFFAAVVVGIDRSAKAECLKWQGDAEKYEKYYIVEWQAEQCQSYDIIINAPVIK